MLHTQRSRFLRPTNNLDRPCLAYDRIMVVGTISEAKAALSALIEAVQNGSEVIIAKAGRPVARLVAFRGPVRPRKPGSRGDLDRS